ncbi:MAG: DUF6427 family protein [Owenweeksia sp.]
MLARLFNNLTVQSLTSSLLVSYLLAGIAVFMRTYEPATLVLPGWSFTVSPTVFQWAAMICLPLYSVWFNSILIRFGFLKGHHHLIPIFTILLLLFGCHENQPAALAAIPLLILIIRQTLRMINAGAEVLQLVFNIGFLIGVVSIFFPPGLILTLVCWVAVVFFGHFSVRTIIIPIMGMASFYFLVYSAYFFFTDFPFPAELWSLLTQFSLNTWNGELHKTWPYLFLLISVLISLIEYVKALNYAKIQKRQFLNFNAAFLVLGIIAFAAFQSPWAGGVIIALPISVFLSNLVQYVSRWWLRDLIYLSLLLTLLLMVF